MNLSKASISRGFNFLGVLLLVIELSVFSFFFLPIMFNAQIFLIKIRSGSMAPFLETGDLILINGIGKDNIDALIGEPIAFFDPLQNRVIVHRAIEKTGDCLITKGDNNEQSDFFQPCPRYLLGKAIKIF